MRDTLISIAKGAALAAGGAALTFLGSYAAGHEGDLLGLVLAAVASVGLNVLRKFGGEAIKAALK